MFRIHDYELTESELALFESTATISPDGYISFPKQSRFTERGSFNVCEILDQWSLTEEFGVQRIRLGNHRPLTKSEWARKIRPTLYDKSIWCRRVSIRACFPSQRVAFRTLGWRLMNLDFWTPGNAIKVAEASEATIRRVLVQCSEPSTFRRGAKHR